MGQRNKKRPPQHIGPNVPPIAFAGWLEPDEFGNNIAPTHGPDTYMEEFAASEWAWRHRGWRERVDVWLEETGQKESLIQITADKLWEKIHKFFERCLRVTHTKK